MRKQKKRTEKSEPIGRLRIGTNITERTRTEERLASEHAVLQAIINSSEDIIIFSLDTEYRYIAFNDKHRREMKKVWNVDVQIGMNLLDCINNPEARNLAKRSVDRALQGESFSEEQHRPEFDIDYEFDWNPVRRGKDVVGVAAFIRDITKRKRADQEILTMARLKAENPEPVLRIARDGMLLFVNDAGLSLLPEWHLQCGKTVPPVLWGIVTRTLNDRVTRLHHLKHRDRDYVFSVTPILETGYANLYGVDITDLKRAEEEVRTLNAELELRVRDRTAELEAANKELEAFSYSVSHDLRAPLRAADGYSHILLDEYGPQLPPDARRYLELVCSNTLHMGHLVDDLLALSSLGRKAMTKAHVKPVALAREALDLLGGEQAGRNLKITVGDLPSCRGDRALLKQVFVNLLSNALKFTRNRDPAVIDVGCCRKDGENVFFVRDNGVGFDMRYVGRLFAVFQRLHRPEDFEGTGVGLAIVQRIVQRHGGRVWAEAELDKGATFFFTLEGEGP
jgi:signal transduction histidine kinase